MAVFDPGTGTLKSTTWEAAFIEACQLLEFAEESSENPEEVQFTTVEHSNVQKTLEVVCNLQANVALNSAGKPEFTAVEHLSIAFTGATDTNATTLQGVVLEIAQTLQEMERANPEIPNNLNLTYNTENGRVLISALIPAVKTIASDGSINIAITPYI